MTIVDEPLEAMLAKIAPYRKVLDRVYDGEQAQPFNAYHDKTIILLNPQMPNLRKSQIEEAVSEAIGNAMTYAKSYNPATPMDMKIFLGEKGEVVQITDSGEGFDYKKVNRKKIFHNQGRGFKHYRAEGIYVSFKNGGRTVNVMGLKEGEQ